RQGDGLRSSRLQDRGPARGGAARRRARPGPRARERSLVPDPAGDREGDGAVPPEGDLSERRFLRGCRLFAAGHPGRAVHPDVRGGPHARLDRERPGAVRGQRADPPAARLHRPAPPEVRADRRALGAADVRPSRGGEGPSLVLRMTPSMARRRRRALRAGARAEVAPRHGRSPHDRSRARSRLHGRNRGRPAPPDSRSPRRFPDGRVLFRPISPVPRAAARAMLEADGSDRMKRILAVASGAPAAALAYWFGLRPWSLRWGATDAERVK